MSTSKAMCIKNQQNLKQNMSISGLYQIDDSGQWHGMITYDK